jgi:hypothetical protein
MFGAKCINRSVRVVYVSRIAATKSIPLALSVSMVNQLIQREGNVL